MKSYYYHVWLKLLREVVQHGGKDYVASTLKALIFPTIRQKNGSLARESSAIYSTPIRDLFTTSMRPNGSSGSTMRLRDSIASIFIDFARFLYDFSEQVLYKYIRTNGRIARTTTIDGATDETVYIYRYIEMLLLYKKKPRLVLSSRISFFSSFSYTSPLLLLQ